MLIRKKNKLKKTVTMTAFIGILPLIALDNKDLLCHQDTFNFLELLVNLDTLHRYGLLLTFYTLNIYDLLLKFDTFFLCLKY